MDLNIWLYFHVRILLVLLSLKYINKGILETMPGKSESLELAFNLFSNSESKLSKLETEHLGLNAIEIKVESASPKNFELFIESIDMVENPYNEQIFSRYYDNFFYESKIIETKMNTMFNTK